MALSINELQATLKEIYIDDLLQEMVEKAYDDPFYKAVEKDTSMGGLGVRVPIVTSDNIRAAGTFAGAYALSDNQEAYAFTLTGTPEVWAFASWKTKTLRFADENRETFLKAVDQKMKSTARALAKKIVTQMYRTRNRCSFPSQHRSYSCV